MEKNGDISPDQRQQAQNEPIHLAGTPYPLEAPHFVMLVRSQVDALFSAEEIANSGGLVVRTSLDLGWQHEAEQAVTRQLSSLRTVASESTTHNVNNAAVVALDPHSGQVLVMVGSPDFNDREHDGAINMAVAPRQPGSALKPFIYARAMDPTDPQVWNAASMILDVTTAFHTRDGRLYTPANYDRQEHGPVLVRQALASSLNIPAVAALNHVGLDAAFVFLRRLGLDSLGNPEDADISLALGGGEVSLLDLTAAYGAFASGGERINPVTILEVHDSQGKLLYTVPTPSAERVMDARVAWLISDILSDDQARSLGFPAHSVLNLDRPAAVKTGTTSNFHDNWTMGYTPDLVVGVWVGNAGQEAMHDVTGLSGAGPIWHAVMRDLLAGQPVHVFQQPSGMQQVEVCALSGLLPGNDCPYRIREWFIEGTQPVLNDSFYQRMWIDRRTGKLAGEGTPLEQRSNVVVLDLPLQAAAWARQRGLLLLSDLISGSAAGQGNNTEPLLTVISPASGSIYVLSSKLPAAEQQVRIEAAGQGICTRLPFLWMAFPWRKSLRHLIRPGGHWRWDRTKSGLRG